MTKARYVLVLLGLLLIGFALSCKSTQTSSQVNQTGNPNANANVETGGVSGAKAPSGKVFRGSIDANRIQMTLNREGEKLSGAYFYQKIGTDISLKGSINAQGDFTLQEFDSGGKQTGEFKGKWSEPAGLPGALLEGTWAKPNSKETQSFYAIQQFIEFTGGMRVVVKQNKEENKKAKYTVDVSYPELTGTPNTNAEKFNQEVKNLIEKETGEFKGDFVATDADPTGDTGLGSDIQIDYDVVLATDELVSVNFVISTYMSGAAHPNSHSKVMNYDLKAGRVLKLADLFKTGSEYLGPIARHTIADLKKQMGPNGDNEWIEKGAAPETENYLSWNISRKGLLMTFDPYVVASYADGPKRVIVPFATLKDVTRPDGPISYVSK